MNKLLIVVDMQNDFIDGTLGTDEAQAILPVALKKIKAYGEAGEDIIFTMDTHDKNYLNTQEGKHLPVEHCIRGTNGWELQKDLAALSEKYNAQIVQKPTFGNPALADQVADRNYDSIELIGLCTDICVVSNALIIKSYIPETPIYVDQACCAGVTVQSHQAAIETMKMCQIQIL